MATKKLAEIITPLVPAGAGEVKAMKPGGVSLINWVPLVKVLPLASGVVNLEWNNPMLGHLNLQNDDIGQDFQEALEASNNGSGLRARVARMQWAP